MRNGSCERITFAPSGVRSGIGYSPGVRSTKPAAMSARIRRMTSSWLCLFKSPYVESPSNPKRTTRSDDFPRSMSAMACMPPLPRGRDAGEGLSNRRALGGEDRGVVLERAVDVAAHVASAAAAERLGFVAEIAKNEVVPARRGVDVPKQLAEKRPRS